MNRLTLKGFLRGYVRELVGLQTDNLRKLCAAVETDSPAAAEALMAFAGTQGKEGYLASLAVGSWMEKGYSIAAEAIQACGSVETYLASPMAPERYRKVWGAYVAKRDAIQVDRRVVSLMRDKTLAALRSSHMSVYRLCKDLGLNEGNVYAYLNAGDTSKVSRATARRIMEHALG